MNMSYCGKDCEKCRAENDHGCEGCKGGKAFGTGDCQIVDCVTLKGIDKCSDCGNKLSCSMIYNNDKLYGLERSGLAPKPAVESKGLGKWFTILFFISIGQLLCSIFDIDLIKNAFPTADTVAIGLSLVCSIVYIAICFVLEKYSDGFKTSAIMLIISQVLSVVKIFLAQDNDFAIITSIVTIFALIFTIVSKCSEFSGCAETTRSSDRGISEQWESLRKWYIWILIGYVVCRVVIFVPLFNIILDLATIVLMIALVVLAITEVVLFGMTMKRFNAIDKAARTYKETTEE